MITKERSSPTSEAPPSQPPPGGPPAWPWWRSWPPLPGRPQPISGRSLLLGGLVVTVVLFLVDGFLGVMAGYAAGSWQLGAAVFGVLFAITWLEFAVVGWASRRRQERDKHRED